MKGVAIRLSFDFRSSSLSMLDVLKEREREGPCVCACVCVCKYACIDED